MVHQLCFLAFAPAEECAAEWAVGQFGSPVGTARAPRRAAQDCLVGHTHVPHDQAVLDSGLAGEASGHALLHPLGRQDLVVISQVRIYTSMSITT